MTRIIDLRTPEEVAGKPDRAVPGARNMQIPLLPAGDSLVNAYDGASATAEYRAVTDSLGGPMGMLYQLQHELAGPYAVSQLGSVFEAILAASGDPALFHCTIGREQWNF